VSFLGVLFAGRYTIWELPVFFQRGFSAYIFGLPLCAVGLIFYTVIIILTLVSWRRSSKLVAAAVPLATEE
jgi:hypothetical protein